MGGVHGSGVAVVDSPPQGWILGGGGGLKAPQVVSGK